MTFNTISQTVLFPDLVDKLLLARFDQPHTSSDGGAVLLKAAEKVTGWWPGSCVVWSTGANPARCGTRSIWRRGNATGYGELNTSMREKHAQRDRTRRRLAGLLPDRRRALLDFRMRQQLRSC